MSELQIGFELEFGCDLVERDLLESLRYTFPVCVNKRGKTLFKYLSDGSVRFDRCNTVAEIITPVFELETGVKIIKSLFNWMNIICAETNKTCGLHINMSFVDKNKTKSMDLPKLVLLLEEERILRNWKRLRNEYCRPHSHTIKSSIKEMQRMGRYARASYNIDEKNLNPKNFMNFALTRNCEKYRSVNLLKMKYTSNPYLEFRMAGNRNYQHRIDDVLSDIKHYTSIMKASTSNYRNTEFKQKLEKIYDENVRPAIHCD